MAVEPLEDRALLAALLPDLFPLASVEQGYIEGWTIDRNESLKPGRTLLRLTTAIPNVGSGPMEIHGSDVLPDGSQQVVQRVYESDGSVTDHEAGTFTFHPEHGHVHFDDFARYSLREVTAGNGIGPMVASGGKVSFCLIDFFAFDTELPDAPDQESYLECETRQQGISVGWADVYDKTLPDQWIDITDVPDGKYWLEVVVDPSNRLLESDETNNTTRIMIDLVASPDRFEPNNTISTATDLGTLADRTESNLSIHASGNDDWYVVTAAADVGVRAEILFRNAEGDLDFEVYSETSPDPLGFSYTISNVESIVWPAVAGTNYYLRVFGYSPLGDFGAINPGYDLVISLAGEPVPDRFEPNDALDVATNLGTLNETIESNLSIHAPDNEDWYRFTVADDGPTAAEILFRHAEGDLDLELYDSTRLDPVGVSYSETDNETIVWPAVAGTTYYLRVFGFFGATNSFYDLVISQTGVIPPDPFEPNDTPDTASDLGTLSERTESNLSIHAPDNDDWYLFTAANDGPAAAEIRFRNAEGDLELELYDDTNLDPLGFSYTESDTETVSWSAVAGTAYYLRVFGFFGATNSNYDLVITQTDVTTTDPFEPNDTLDAASNLGTLGERTESNLSIHVPNNDDWYRFTAANDGPTTAEIRFRHAEGDLDFELYDNTSFEPLGFSYSESDNESILWTAAAGTTYYLRVFGFSGATNSNYDLVITQTDVKLPSLDRFEFNDTISGATDLGTLGDRTEPNLSIHSIFDVDWFRFTAGANGSMRAAALFSNAKGDLDLELYEDPYGPPLDVSYSVTDDETIVWSAVAGATYYLRVFGFAANSQYELQVTQHNGAPFDLTLVGGTVYENVANGTSVATVFTTDPDSDETFTYSLVNNADGRFTINQSTGEITVADGGLLDFQSASSHRVTVRVTDRGGLTFDENFTINITNVPALPTISNIARQLTFQDRPTDAIPFTVGDAETPAEDLVITGTSSNPVVLDEGIVFGGSGTNRWLVITPVPNQAGTTVISVTVRDADGGEATQTFELQVNAFVPQPGDANKDRVFNQLDLVLVLQAAKFMTGQFATFEEGDWNLDGVFDQLDLVAALQTANYLDGAYASVASLLDNGVSDQTASMDVHDNALLQLMNPVVTGPAGSAS